VTGPVIVTDQNNIIGIGEGYTFTIPAGTYTRAELTALVAAEQRRVAAEYYPAIVLTFPRKAAER
jgi:hypothetical protein